MYDPALADIMCSVASPGTRARSVYGARVGSCEACRLPTPVPSPIEVVAPGKPIPVWSGSAWCLSNEPAVSCSAQLALVWRRSFTLELTLNEPRRGWWPHDALQHAVDVGFDGGPHVRTLQLHRLNEVSGWCNGGVLGDREQHAIEVRAVLTNQPRIFGGGLHDHDTGAEWSGHWSTVTDGWCITIDALPTLTEDFRTSERDQTFALTHTVRLARADESTFAYAAASNVTYGLQVALSFAAGYWIGLICPTGYDRGGAVTWMEVGPSHNGRASRCGAWFSDARPGDLDELLTKFLPMWREPEPTDPLRSATTSSILSHGSGFVEQRIITALSALETLSWTLDVIESGMPEKRWRGEGASTHLKRLLQWLHIDPGHTHLQGREAISAWGCEHGWDDLPASVVAVRNAVTHPKPGENIYAHDGVLTQAWQLAVYWLQLAVLRRIGYNGHAADTADLTRWAGDSDPVPWSLADSQDDLDRS